MPPLIIKFGKSSLAHLWWQALEGVSEVGGVLKFRDTPDYPGPPHLHPQHFFPYVAKGITEAPAETQYDPSAWVIAFFFTALA